jgi:hypothetical protein
MQGGERTGARKRAPRDEGRARGLGEGPVREHGEDQDTTPRTGLGDLGAGRLLGADVDAAGEAGVVGEEAAAKLDDGAGDEVGDAEDLDVGAAAAAHAGDDQQVAVGVGGGGDAGAAGEAGVVGEEAGADRGDGAGEEVGDAEDPDVGAAAGADAGDVRG